MTDEKPEPAIHVQPVPADPVLRREALLPNERSRGLGTVAVIGTMAGVASGLALATTLMAMQVADGLSNRACGYRPAHVAITSADGDHGFLGIRYWFRNGAIEVVRVVPGTPAEAVGLQAGDQLISIDGDRVDSMDELQDRIFGAPPGSVPSILIERAGDSQVVRPTLAAWPVIEE